MITESIDMLRSNTSALETHCLSIEEGGCDCVECFTRGGFHSYRRIVREGAQTIAGLGGCERPHRRSSVCDWGAAGTIVVRSGIHSTCNAIVARSGDMGAGRLDDARPPAQPTMTKDWTRTGRVNLLTSCCCKRAADSPPISWSGPKPRAPPLRSPSTDHPGERCGPE